MSPCAEGLELRRAQPWLGTLVELTIRGENETRLLHAIDAAFASMAQVHRLMSFHNPASDISRLNAAEPGKKIRLHRWTFRVLQSAARFARESDGIFDVTVAAHLAKFGFLPSDSAMGKRGGTWQDLEMEMDGSVTKHRPLMIDLGGIAKGFAVDTAVRRLRQTPGIVTGLVNAGGDLRAFGPFAWPVSIRDASDPGRMVATLNLKNAALATSAGYFRNRKVGGVRITALLDGRTRLPLAARFSVSILAPTAMVADALTKIAAADAPGTMAFLKKHRAKVFRQRNDALDLPN